MSLLFPAISQLRIVFLSLLRFAEPLLELPLVESIEVQKFMPSLMEVLGQHSELWPAIHQLSQPLLAHRETWDLHRWSRSVSTTVNRAGFVLCDDLEIAGQALQVEPSLPGAPPASEKIKELLTYCVSPEYLSLSERLDGTAW
jgi:hypothetical protein